MKQLLFFLIMTNLVMRSKAQDAKPRLDSLFKTMYKQEEPGAAVFIEAKGKIIFNQGYGLANLANHAMINNKTNFNIGSLTKQFTAYAILQLVKEKRLSLDDKLGSFFPGFNPITGNLITVRQLLTHSSGIMDHYGFTDTNKVKHAVDKDVLEAVKDLDKTYFTPGKEYRYSNTAYCLLALIIEKLTGMSFSDYIRKHIFEPLSMTHSVVLTVGQQIYNRAVGYDTTSKASTFQRLDANESIFFSTEGDGGVYTSVQDYLRWYHALQKEGLADRDIVQEARSGQFEIDKAKKLWYGFGWFVSNQDSATAVYHSGSNGGFRAMVFTIPSRDYVVVLFSNRTDIDLETIVQQINTILHIGNKLFTKIDSLVSFMDCWPNFAPCKEIPSYSTSFKKSLSASAMALN
jgi:D-alanyl-D-alanine carboxypeptidase